MKTCTFLAPAGLLAHNQYQIDAHLWAWVEVQQIATFDNITCADGAVTFTLHLEPTASQLGALLVAFAENFGR